MKPFICFAVVLFSVCGADDEAAPDMMNVESGRNAQVFNSQDDHYISVQNKGIYVGNPDDFGEIEKPCEIYDINCIRCFFAEHATCVVANGPVPDPLFQAESSIQFPRVNLTLIQTYLSISGLNGRISEFYINRATDNLVIAIEFNNLNITSQNSFFEYFRFGKEPVYTEAYMTVKTSVTVTAVIPNINDLQLQKAEMTGYTDVGYPPFFISPSAAKSSDPQPARTYKEMLKNVPSNMQAFFLTEAPFYGAAFIQYNICDFKLKVY